MPSFGFGAGSPPKDKLVGAIKVYLSLGGRLINTAHAYGNHKLIGVAIRESGIKRDEMWITTKVHPTLSNGGIKTASDVIKVVDESLQDLGISYIDLVEIHAATHKHEERQALWTGLINARDAGKVMTIGVSNFNRDQIEKLEKATGVLPSVNELEFHPWIQKEAWDLVDWCKSKGIVVTAYRIFGSSKNRAQSAAVAQVAQKYGVSNSQVLLRWALDMGLAVTPGASSKEHIMDNLSVLNLKSFTLSSEDNKLITSSPRPKDWAMNCQLGVLKKSQSCTRS
eukprot:gnl/MRDRNA2_/MRDRNA2_80608_c0_seq1.p1 gnl/MRDRNA2_/MRDRNA2_80608_c0~~gnl/MRDRNA2_/MRDRNA2_80608_c0_seq1.p1  ORF type:complete len:282 (+),score=45.59 gnl/MRDRNA2_/MRDRNA2_80608_c0_seq1:113-958(+)